jgi:hypothetical protein
MLLDITCIADMARRLQMWLAFASRETSAAVFTCWTPIGREAWLSRGNVGQLLTCTESKYTSQRITQSARERYSEVFCPLSIATHLQLL